jgi:uncharacterized protein YqhQ
MVQTKRNRPELMIGGQAVIEGVMMRTKNYYAVAVRNERGKIIVKRKKFISATAKSKIMGLPLIRGVALLYETLLLGIKVLNYSASVSIDATEKEKKNLDKGIIITLIISLVFAIGIFKLIPLLIAYLFKNMFGGGNITFNVIDGVAKFTLLITYMVLISLIPDVKRLFAYHGAEHKTVACYESGKDLTVKNVMKCRKEHPRCGTSFIIYVLVLSILFYMFIPINTGFWEKLALRIIFLPIIAGISYELIRLAGKYDNLLTRILVSPGMLVQKITTLEPDKKQAEVAIASLKAIL